MRVKILALSIILVLVLLCIKSLYEDKCVKRQKYREERIDTLVEELSSPENCVRSIAALDLQKIGSKGKAAVPRLVALLKDPNAHVRWRSVAALGHIGYFPDEVKKALYSAYNDKNETVQYNTLFAMSRMQYEFPADKKGLFRPDQEYKISPEGFKVFLKALNHPSPNIVKKALTHLDARQINENGKEYRPFFRERLLTLEKSRDNEIRGMALYELGRLFGSQKIQELRPHYKKEIAAFQDSQNPIVKRSAEKMMAEIEGKTYPLLLNMVDGSIEQFKKLCASGQRNELYHCYYYGELLLYQGKTEEAYTYFEKDCPEDDVYIGVGCEKLGDRALAEGKVEEAKKYYMKVSQIVGIKFDSPIKLGNIYQKEGDLREACRWYLKGCSYGNTKACSKAENCAAP